MKSEQTLTGDSGNSARSRKISKARTRFAAQARRNASAASELTAPISDVASAVPPPTPPPGPPASVPSAATPSIVVRQSVNVNSDFTSPDLQPDHLLSFISTSAEVEAMPGAYGDVPRYVQTMPGVSAESDLHNTYLVRGGNPNENLFVINGFEIPNINQFSTFASTAGFISMVDTDTLSSIVLHTGGWSSGFSDRLSSVLEMNTLGPPADRLHNTEDIGLGGVGLISNRPFGDSGSALISVRRSFLNLFTNNIGIDGVPVYQSALATFMRPLSAKDSLSGIGLGAMDSILISPAISDWDDPLSCNDKAHSDRYNLGLQWQHSYRSRGMGALSFTHANEHATDVEAWALPASFGSGESPALGSPVYSDNLTNRISTLRYSLLLPSPSRVHAQLGGSYSANKIDYDVNQASGFPNPYIVQDVPMDALNVQTTPLATEQGLFGDLVASPNRSLEITAGARYQRWGLNRSHAISPHAGVTWNLKSGLSMFANASRVSQVPPYLYLLVEPQNLQLKPINAQLAQFGVVEKIAGLKLELTFYRKTYGDYPVATEYPALSMANVIDTFGQPFLWFPMTSKGRGHGTGAEIGFSTSTARRIYVRVAASESSIKYSALDGVSRPGNYDYPFNGTVFGGWRIGKRSLVTARYSMHTGAPYTPFLVDDSNQQDRPIYDLSQVNGRRGPMYERLDMRLERTFNFRHTGLKVYGGGDNVLDRANFYQWIMCPQYPSLNRQPYMLTQMGFYPEGGVTWRF